MIWEREILDPLTDEGVHRLRVAIVRQAAHDYVHFHRIKRRYEERNKTDHERYREAVKEIRDAENFLKSDWAVMLVDLDCVWILNKIKEFVYEDKTFETEDI